MRSALVAAAGAAVAVPGSLVALARAAAQGAAESAAQSRDPSDALRQVIEGVADGLITTAQALQMTVREAASKSRTFAREELDRAADEFGSLATCFVESIEDGIRATGAHVDDMVSKAREHAHVALRRAWPVFAAAASTARRDPTELGAATLESGPAIARGALGALRKELAAQLRALGVEVTEPT